MPPPDRSSARSIEHGEVLGILGPNGPGRSTTVGIGQRSRRVAGNLEVEAYRRRLLPSPRDRSTKEVEVEVKELGHIVLYVRDIERSSGFYRDVLGWRQVLPEPGQPSRLPMAMFSAPATTLSPTASTSPTRTATRSSCTSTCPASTGAATPL